MTVHRIFWIVFAASVAGAFMTGMPEGDEAPATLESGAVSADPAAAMALSGQKDLWGGEIQLSRRADGHFYANPTIGGQQLDVMVDTGASFVALTGDDARAAGLDWSESDLQPVARGASGVVEGVPVMIDRIELGGTEMRDIEGAIVPEGLPVTLLGQSYLRRFERVEIDGDSMILSRD
ncbi:MAG: TIGR02281 family clan AA aspartic protease [Croceicoccus sp.]|nr:TIGR02281 family clan AA aspartic protease [Croceicoccus sp.]MAL25222.1 TIGR02281 family clan AA aspartic protease [Croceicoccus sp.]|tara:strand:- start:50728 stop:51264 length:537 start_codon:yes stop_codon:yes gene_type:complete